jgi:isorenieratene synthase
VLTRGDRAWVPQDRHVVVVGGGLAGLAAATVLVERGARVTVLEREPFVGGRAGAWDDQLTDGTPIQMERGFHAFFRQYYNLRALMRRVDPGLSMIEPLHDYPVYGPDGQMESFADLPRRAPFNVAALVRRTPTLGMRELAGVSASRALEMLRYDPEHTYRRWDGWTAKEYLDSLRFPDAARRMLFEVFAHSFFNPEERYSAAELLMQFHFYFMGNPEGLVFDVMSKPFSRGLMQPLAHYVRARGGTLRTGCTVTAVEPTAEGTHVWTDSGERISADGVVLALPVPGLQQVTGASPQLGTAEWQQAVQELDVTLPFAVWRLWLDRPVRNDRAPFVGTAGMGLLDNISVYDHFEEQSRAWASRTGGSVVELHAYAVPEHTDEATLRESMLGGLHRLYPETREARVVDERFLWRRDCPAFPPRGHDRRPEVETPDPAVTLAGDFVRLPLPSALMERAVASGFAAASRLLERWDVRGEPLWSVPRRGLASLSVGSLRQGRS